MFAWGPRGPAGSWRTDQGAVVDRAALGTLGLDGGRVLGELGRDDARAELQDLLVAQSWTLGDPKALSLPPTFASPPTANSPQGPGPPWAQLGLSRPSHPADLSLLWNPELQADPRAPGSRPARWRL